MSSTP